MGLEGGIIAGSISLFALIGYFLKRLDNEFKETLASLKSAKEKIAQLDTEVKLNTQNDATNAKMIAQLFEMNKDVRELILKLDYKMEELKSKFAELDKLVALNSQGDVLREKNEKDKLSLEMQQFKALFKEQESRTNRIDERYNKMFELLGKIKMTA